VHASAQADAWIARVPSLWWIAGLGVASWLIVAGVGGLVLMGLKLFAA
jgi:hypothetical protein